jgi:hypothetical protein
MFYEDETLMLCIKCWDHEDARAEYEIERQREEAFDDRP